MPRFLRYKTPTGQVLEVEWSGKGEPTQEDIAYGRELAMREFQKTGPMQMGAYAGAKGQGVYTPPKPAKPGPLPKFLQPAPKPLPKPQAKMGLMSKVDELVPRREPFTGPLILRPKVGGIRHEYKSPEQLTEEDRKNTLEQIKYEQDKKIREDYYRSQGIEIGPDTVKPFAPGKPSVSEDRFMEIADGRTLADVVEYAAGARRGASPSDKAEAFMRQYKAYYGANANIYDIVARVRTEQARRLGSNVPSFLPGGDIIAAYVAGTPQRWQLAQQQIADPNARPEQGYMAWLDSALGDVMPIPIVDDLVHLGIKGVAKSLGFGAKGITKVADYFAGKGASQSGEAVARAVREAGFSTSDTGLLNRLKGFTPKEALDYKPGETPNLAGMANEKKPSGAGANAGEPKKIITPKGSLDSLERAKNGENVIVDFNDPNHVQIGEEVIRWGHKLRFKNVPEDIMRGMANNKSIGGGVIYPYPEWRKLRPEAFKGDYEFISTGSNTALRGTEAGSGATTSKGFDGVAHGGTVKVSPNGIVTVSVPGKYAPKEYRFRVYEDGQVEYLGGTQFYKTASMRAAEQKKLAEPEWVADVYTRASKGEFASAPTSGWRVHAKQQGDWVSQVDAKQLAANARKMYGADNVRVTSNPDNPMYRRVEVNISSDPKRPTPNTHKPQDAPPKPSVPGIPEISAKANESLGITNMDALPRGVGAKYIVGIESPDGKSIIAKRWARKPDVKVKGGDIVVDLDGNLVHPPRNAKLDANVPNAVPRDVSVGQGTNSSGIPNNPAKAKEPVGKKRQYERVGDVSELGFLKNIEQFNLPTKKAVGDAEEMYNEAVNLQPDQRKNVRLKWLESDPQFKRISGIVDRYRLNNPSAPMAYDDVIERLVSDRTFGDWYDRFGSPHDNPAPLVKVYNALVESKGLSGWDIKQPAKKPPVPSNPTTTPIKGLGPDSNTYRQPQKPKPEPTYSVTQKKPVAKGELVSTSGANESWEMTLEEGRRLVDDGSILAPDGTKIYYSRHGTESKAQVFDKATKQFKTLAEWAGDDVPINDISAAFPSVSKGSKKGFAGKQPTLRSVKSAEFYITINDGEIDFSKSGRIGGYAKGNIYIGGDDAIKARHSIGGLTLDRKVPSYTEQEWRKAVESALAEGKPVPDNVVDEFLAGGGKLPENVHPEIKAKYAKPNSSEIPEKSAVPDSSIPSKPINEPSMNDVGVEPPTVPPKPTESGMPKSSPGSTSYARAEKLTEEGKLSSSKRPEPIKIDDVPSGNFDDALAKAREINAKYVDPKAAKANAVEINKTFGDFLEAYDARMNQLDTEYKTADASRKIEIDEERAKLFAAGEEVAQANAAEGSEAGMKLRMRQEIRGARNEVELAAAIDRELERSIGRKMTKEERDQVIPRGRKVREAHAKVTAAEQADNEAIFQDILRSVGVKTDGGIKQTVDARKASIKQDVEGIRKIIAKYSKGGTTKQSGAILDVPKIMAEAAPLIMNIVKKSVANAKDITVDKAITIIREVFDRFGLDHSAMKDEDIIGVIAGRFRQTAREASEVSKRVAELRKMARSMDVDGQIETANRRLASVAKQIEDFKAGREPKTETAKGRVIADDKLAALNQTQGAIKEQLKVLRELKAQNVTPEQMIEKIDKRISDIEARTKENIKSGTWPKRSQRTMPTSIELEKRLEELKIAQIEADMARRHLREAAELKEMTKGQKALAGIETAYNAVRQLNASTDISWSFNHGWYTVFTHPGVWARSTVGGLKGIRTAEGYKKAVADVMSDPAFREARAAGLRVLDLLGHHDEYLRGIDYEHSKSLIARTAGYGVTVSQRNFDLTSTKARLEMYGKFVRFMESPWLGARKLTFDDKRNIAWAVNMMTGALPGNLIQGKIPQMIWFAPGYRIAKLMTSTPALSVLAVGRDPKLAAGLFADWLKFSAVGLAVLGMMPRGEDTTMARDSGLPQFGNLVRHTGATVVDGEIKDEFMNFDLFNGWLKPWGVLQQSIGRGKDFESWINENRENPSDSAIRAAEKASGIGYGEPGFDKALADYYNSKRSGKNKDWTAIFEGSAHPGGTLLARIASDIAGSPQKAFGETYDARLDKATTDAMGFFASLWPYAKSVLPLSAQTFINEVYPANLSDSQKAVLFIVAFTGFNMNRKVVDVRKGDQYDGKIENPVNFRKP